MAGRPRYNFRNGNARKNTRAASWPGGGPQPQDRTAAAELHRDHRTRPAAPGPIGRALTERDEPAAALVAAFRRPSDDPARVTMPVQHRPSNPGLTPCRLPRSTALSPSSRTPWDWVDFDLINAGAKAYRSYGRNVRDVMADLCLIGGYRFGAARPAGVDRPAFRVGCVKRMGETVTGPPPLPNTTECAETQTVSNSRCMSG